MKNLPKSIRLFVVTLTALLNSITTKADSPDIHAMINRSLSYIQEAGTEWRNEKKCVSCHRTTFTTWSLNRAAEVGFEINSSKLQDWNSWSRDWINHVAEKRRDEANREVTLVAENDSIAQLLLGRRIAAAQEQNWVTEYRDYLLKSQNENGSWKAGGQLPLQKRPKRETQEVSTMWAFLALHNSGPKDKTMDQAATAATKWLGEKTKGVSTEWWSTQLLLKRALKNDEAADQAKAELLQQQNNDGGWGWLINSESDALGTGIVLYALAQDHADASDSKIAKALLFLQQTQDIDGSWPVNGTKKNSADEATETATYWGTCWAVIALTEFTDKKSIDSAKNTTHQNPNVVVQ